MQLIEPGDGMAYSGHRLNGPGLPLAAGSGAADARRMILVHVRIRSAEPLPESNELIGILGAHVTPGERVDHFSVHPEGPRSLTVGCFVVAGLLLVAENVALAVLQRALRAEPALRGATITSCSGALVAAYFERLRDSAGRGGRSMRLPDQDIADC
ncbi:hypothetical protein [Streptomyces sp. NPDC090025]|uniref:hypothetical protein n=1 Tax=Streptomyces sp. NPDC090025 TaxID=3365922 RepID=UPI0038334B82